MLYEVITLGFGDRLFERGVVPALAFLGDGAGFSIVVILSFSCSSNRFTHALRSATLMLGYEAFKERMVVFVRGISDDAAQLRQVACP